MLEEKEALDMQEEDDIVEFTDDNGKIMKFYHIGTIEYQERFFAFFQAAEEIEGIEPEEVIIYEVTGEAGHEELIPVEDEATLDAVYEEFCRILEEDDCDCGDEGCDCGCHHHH